MIHRPGIKEDGFFFRKVAKSNGYFPGFEGVPSGSLSDILIH